MDVLRHLRENGPKLSLGELDEAQTDLLYDILLQMEQDHTLENSKSLSFLAPLYLQAQQEGNEGACKGIEALAMQIGIPQQIGKADGKQQDQKANKANHRTFTAKKEADIAQIPSRPMPADIRKIEEKVEKKISLTPEESLADMEWRKQAHEDRVRMLGCVDGTKITNLVLCCSDSRPAVLTYQDFQDGTRVVYVAGNVAHALKRPDVAQLLENLDERATITVLGHTQCGAVACACQAHQYARLDNIPQLLERVNPNGVRQNIISQVMEIRDMDAIRQRVLDGSLRVVGMMLDLKEQRIEVYNGEKGRAPNSIKKIAQRMEMNFRLKNLGKNLEENQYAPVAIVCGSDLKVSGREIFDMGEANRAFCITASGSKSIFGVHIDSEALASTEMAMLHLLDADTLASVQYSIINNSTRHIALVHTDERVLDVWKSEMMEKSPIIRKAVEEGTVVINRFLYHEETGHAQCLDNTA